MDAFITRKLCAKHFLIVKQAPKLFNGMKLYSSLDFVLAFKNKLNYLVIVAGGAVYEKMEEKVAFESME